MRPSLCAFYLAFSRAHPSVAFRVRHLNGVVANIGSHRWLNTVSVRVELGLEDVRYDNEKLSAGQLESMINLMNDGDSFQIKVEKNVAQFEKEGKSIG